MRTCVWDANESQYRCLSFLISRKKEEFMNIYGRILAMNCWDSRFLLDRIQVCALS